MLRIKALAVLLVLALLGCQPPAPMAELRVAVEPPGALVTLWLWSPVVPRGGEHEPSDPIRVQQARYVYDLIPGTYLIEVSAQGYQDANMWLDIAAGERKHVIITLTRH